MTTPVAQMRASHMRSNIAALEGLERRAQTEVFARCGDGIERVRSALPISWLPLSLNIDLVECVYDVCGREAARDWVHDSIRRSMLGTLLRPVVDGLTRLGLGPHHGLRRCVGGWNLVYKDCGLFECEKAEVGEAKLVLNAAPKAMLSSGYLNGLIDAFEGVAKELGGDEFVRDITTDIHLRRVVFELRWQSARSGPSR